MSDDPALNPTWLLDIARKLEDAGMPLWNKLYSEVAADPRELQLAARAIRAFVAVRNPVDTHS